MTRSEIKTKLAAFERRLYNESGDLFKYARDPVAYAREHLRIKHLTPDQVSVLTAAADPRCRLLVPSGNELGKSFTAAVLMSWHYDCHYPSLTLSTAPSNAQVTDILFRELRKLRRNDPDFLPKANVLQRDADRLCKGYTAKDGTSFHGRHDASVMLIMDEAEGIDSQFWEAAESFADRWICFYNPTSASSQTAIEERTGLWKIIRMSAFNHPNVIRGIEGKDPVIPSAITWPKVKDRLKKWATVIPDGLPGSPDDVVIHGVRYRLGPVAQARLLGVRPSKPVNAVFEAAVLDDLRVKKPDPHPDHPIQFGVDVARFGDDMSVIHARRGTQSFLHESHNGLSTVQLADRVIYHYKLLNSADQARVHVVVDSACMGVGVVDELFHRGIRVIPVNGSSPASDPEEFPNLRSQLMFDFQDIANARLADFSLLSEDSVHDITEQLRATYYTLDNRGRRVVASKDLLKSALGRSPDDADAVLLAYYQFPETYERY